MQRKGGKTISSKAEAVNTSAPTTTTTTTTTVLPLTTAAGNSGVVAADPFPAVQIPTLDIFARFQGQRDDFEAEWLMLEDDQVDGNKAPPISDEVASKLRRHQQVMSATRAAAKATAVAVGATTSDASATGKQQRRAPLMNASDDDDDDGDEVVESSGANNGNDDEEYVPEGKDAAQYRSKAKGKIKGEPSQSTAVAENEAEEVKDGLQGDYLTFLPKSAAATAANPNADTKDLQAVVSIGSALAPQQQQEARSSSGSKTGKRGGTTPQSPPPAAATPADQLTVPLWCEERVRRFGGYYPANRLVALHQEICDLVDLLRPTQEEISIRRYVELEVGKITKRLWPKSRLVVYGSLYTHLLLPLSDVDMTLTNMPASLSHDEALTLLANEVSKAGLCQATYPQVILKTRVPLIKFQHKGSLVDIDISVNAIDGKANSDIVISLLNFYPEARPLIVLVKYFLQQRDMHEPYHGGLGSYATTLLVISFLQNHPCYTTRPQERPFTGLGKLLVDFFRYQGQYWSYHKCGVSLAGGGHYFRRSEESMFSAAGAGPMSPSSPSSPRSPLMPQQAVVEDPLNAANNAASSLRNLHMISSAFANAYQALTAPFPTAFEMHNNAYVSGEEGSGNAYTQLAQLLSDFSPDSPRLALRPTLLSRVLHVDPDTVYRRQSIAVTYAALVAADPEGMAEVEQFLKAEDAPMLTGVHVTRKASFSPSGSPSASAVGSPVSPAEAKSIASLAAVAAKRAATKRVRKTDRGSSSSSSSSASAVDVDDDSDSDGDHDDRRPVEASKIRESTTTTGTAEKQANKKKARTEKSSRSR